PGLNLTHAVREGVLKHTAWKADFPFPLDFPEGLRWESGGSLEAQVVNWSDEIAQQTHDLEDGLPLTEELVEGSRVRIERWLETSRIATADDFYARRERLPGDLVAFSESGKRLYTELREFVYRHIIHSFPVSRHDGHARRVLAGVFTAYRDNPRLLPDARPR